MKHFKEGYKSDPDHKGLKKAYKELKSFLKLHDKAFPLKGNHAACLEMVNDALKILHGESLMESPEVDIVTIKLRELQCRSYAGLGQTNEAMQCANRVLQHDNGSIEGRKWRCEAHMQMKRWDAAVQDCQVRFECTVLGRVEYPIPIAHPALVCFS